MLNTQPLKKTLLESQLAENKTAQDRSDAPQKSMTGLNLATVTAPEKPTRQTSSNNSEHPHTPLLLNAQRQLRELRDSGNKLDLEALQPLLDVFDTTTTDQQAFLGPLYKIWLGELLVKGQLSMKAAESLSQRIAESLSEDAGAENARGAASRARIFDVYALVFESERNSQPACQGQQEDQNQPYEQALNGLTAEEKSLLCSLLRAISSDGSLTSLPRLPPELHALLLYKLEQDPKIYLQFELARLEQRFITGKDAAHLHLEQELRAILPRLEAREKKKLQAWVKRNFLEGRRHRWRMNELVRAKLGELVTPALEQSDLHALKIAQTSPDSCPAMLDASRRLQKYVDGCMRKKNPQHLNPKTLAKLLDRVSPKERRPWGKKLQKYFFKQSWANREHRARDGSASGCELWRVIEHAQRGEPCSISPPASKIEPAISGDRLPTHLEKVLINLKYSQQELRSANSGRGLQLDADVYKSVLMGSMFTSLAGFGIAGTVLTAGGLLASLFTVPPAALGGLCWFIVGQHAWRKEAVSEEVASFELKDLLKRFDKASPLEQIVSAEFFRRWLREVSRQYRETMGGVQDMISVEAHAALQQRISAAEAIEGEGKAQGARLAPLLIALMEFRERPEQALESQVHSLESKLKTLPPDEAKVVRGQIRALFHPKQAEGKAPGEKLPGELQLRVYALGAKNNEELMRFVEKNFRQRFFPLPTLKKAWWKIFSGKPSEEPKFPISNEMHLGMELHTILAKLSEKERAELSERLRPILLPAGTESARNRFPRIHDKLLWMLHGGTFFPNKEGGQLGIDDIPKGMFSSLFNEERKWTDLKTGEVQASIWGPLNSEEVTEIELLLASFPPELAALWRQTLHERYFDQGHPRVPMQRDAVLALWSLVKTSKGTASMRLT